MADSRRLITLLGLVQLPEDPVDGESGDMYWNTTDAVVRIHNGTVWTDLGGTAVAVIEDPVFQTRAW